MCDELVVPTPGSVLCPWQTASLPGIGGHILCDPTHFIVDEIPAYLPLGEGNHVFVHVKKRGLTTPAMVLEMAKAAGIEPNEIGVAGRKDRHATTTQWISLPCDPVDPGNPDIEILEAVRHTNKLRMGHLKGNRFCVRLSGVVEDASERIDALITEIKKGIPNYFGHQRLNERGFAQALRFVNQPRKRVRDPKFLASILQSAHFNLYLGERVRRQALHTCFEGDLLKKRETGGLFVCTDTACDQQRMNAGEIDSTGPMWGGKSTLLPTGDMLAWEDDALDALKLSEEAIRTLARFAPGTRRVNRIVPQNIEYYFENQDLIIKFALPAGSFATVFLGELSHAEDDLRQVEDA